MCFDILNARRDRAEEMVFSEGTSGWDAAEWAAWGKTQALKAGDIERARMCEDLEENLERMRDKGVFVVLGECDSDYLSENFESNSSDYEEVSEGEQCALEDK